MILDLFKSTLPNGHDIWAHATYAKLFYQALSEGQFPVRWVEWVRNGYGQPLFNFYQVGFYYLVSLFHTFFPSLVFSLNLSVIFLWIFGSFFTFLFTKRFGIIPALFATFVYMFSPYLLLDIFVRAAFPEFMAISFVPAIFWALERILFTRKIIYLIFLALFFAIVIIAHLPAIVIFLPVLASYTLFLIWQKEVGIQSGTLVIVGLLLGVGVSSFYLFPAILELQFIQNHLLRTGNFDFHYNFIQPFKVFSYIWGYSDPWKESEILSMVFLGVIQWGIILGSILALSFKKLRVSYFSFWLGVIVYALFFMHGISVRVWETFSFLSFIQFPWRYFMVFPLASAVLAAYMIKFISKNYRLGFLALLILLVVFIYPNYFSSKSFISASSFDLSYEEWRVNQEIQKKAYFEKGYNPVGTNTFPEENIDRWIVKNGEGGVKIKELKGHHLVFEIDAKTPFNFIVANHYFPGWKATLDGNETRMEIDRRSSYLSLNIPSGNHLLEISFIDTLVRKVSNIVSLISLFILALMTLLFIVFPILITFFFHLFKSGVVIRKFIKMRKGDLTS